MCHISADPLQENLITALEMLLRMVPASGCWFSGEEERKRMGGIRWEVMNNYWNGTQCALLPLQIQKLIVFVLSHRGVLSCLRFPVLRTSVLWGRHTVLSVVGGVHQAASVVQVLWVSRQDSRVKSMQTVSWREDRAFATLERNALNSEEILWWQSVLQHLAIQFCILQSCIHETYFLGLPQIIQHCQTF